MEIFIMDHSIQGYLERQSTEILEAYLFYYSECRRYEVYKDSVELVWKTLNDRAVLGTYKIPECICEVWNRIEKRRADKNEK